MVVSRERGEVATGTPLTVALIAGVALVGVALWASARGGRGVADTDPVPGSPEAPPVGDAGAALLPTRVPVTPDTAGASAAAEVDPDPSVTEAAHVPYFLPPELQVLAIKIPDQLAAFEDASPTERLHLARPLLASSIAVLMCAHGTGPLEPGAPGDGNLSFVGQGGVWSFHLNDRTFHFRDTDFPEYAEYIPLLSSVYDDDMKLVSLTTELPEDLGQRIANRAYEALSWL